MRLFKRDVPGVEIDEQTDAIIQPSAGSPNVDMSRRTFLSLAFAALVLEGCKSDGESGKIIERTGVLVDTPESLAEKYDLDTLRKMIIEKYPHLGYIQTNRTRDPDGNEKTEETINANFRKIGLQDEYQDDLLIQAYFLKVTYQDLINDQIIWKTDSVVAYNYLNPLEKMWPKKLQIVDKDHEQDMSAALANLISQNTFQNAKNPSEKMDYQKFTDLASKVVKDVTTKMGELEAEAVKELQVVQENYDANSNDETELQLKRAKSRKYKYDLMNDYTSLIDSDFLVGLSIHEVMPTDYNDVMRITLLRALFEEGFKINEVPAYHDNVASFGVSQMTVGPYEGRNRGHGFGQETEMKKVDGTELDKRGRIKKIKVLKEFNLIGDIEPYLEDFGLPHQLCECTQLEDQLKSGMLLLLVNFRTYFQKQLSGNDRFLKIWNDSSLIERRTFLATILGAAHNNPRNAKLSLEQCIGWDRPQLDSADYFLDDNQETKEVVTNLTQLRTAYLNIAFRVHKISAREGERTSDLVARFSLYTVDSQETVEKVAQVTPSPVEVPDTSLPPEPTEQVKPVQKEYKLVKHRELKLLERKRLVKSKINGETTQYSYYTFNFPNWDIKVLAQHLCGNSSQGTIDSIKTFNEMELDHNFKPGEPILIPKSIMDSTLQNPVLIEIKVPNGVNKNDYLRSVLKPGVDPQIAVIYTLTKSPASSLDDLGDLIRVPKALIK